MKEKILRLIELKTKIIELENSDKEKSEIIKSGSYALAEGYVTDNMRLIEILEKEIDEIRL